MAEMCTLHEIAIKFAKKQPGMADSLTEEAPILGKCKWIAATHGKWNVAEKRTDVEGPAFIELDAPLPKMSASSDLVHTDLHLMAGTMQVPTMKAQTLGGVEKYFADNQDVILKKAGMDAERQIMLKNWFKAAQSEKNFYNAGGTGKGWFILAVRFDDHNNIGLYDPGQFDQGRLFKISLPYGGSEHLLEGEYEGVYGYSVIYRSVFGWQILDASRTCAGIVNIDENHKPTPAQIDDMLAQVRAQPGSTYLFCGPQAKIYGLNPYKVDHIQLVNGDTDAKTRIETWNGIGIVQSYNFMDKINNVTQGVRA